MASHTSTLRKSFLDLARQWPADPLRSPALQFSASLQSAAQRIFEVPPPPASASTSAADKGKGASGEMLKELKGEDLLNAARSVDALERLLSNAAKTQFPITAYTLKPASYPNHYSRLQEGIDRAKRGETLDRGWFSWIRWQRA